MKTRTLKIPAATKLLPLLLLLVLPAVAQAQYYYTNGLDIWSYSPKTGPATITGYSGPGGALTIPSTINGYPVTSIGYEAFIYNTSMTSIIIPASVTSIGEYAFEYCFSLTGVYFLGNSPTPTNDLTVFSDDSNVTVSYLTGTTGWGTTFDGLPTALLNPAANFNYTTFNNAVTITGYIGPAGVMIIPSTINGYPVTTIGVSAFNGNYSVTGITILGANLTSIGVDAFQACGLTSVTIPASVTSIGSYAFSDCNLTSVNIPASVTSIGDEAFNYTPTLIAITVDASNPDYSSLGGVLFDKAQATLLQYPGSLFKSYTIPASVTSIGDGAFEDCYGLTNNITIPDSVTSIGDYAFAECHDLTSITIPAGVTNIGPFAFAACSELTNIGVDASNPDYSSLGGVFFDKSQVTLLQFPGGLGGSYTISNTVTSIGTSAFVGCYRLTSVIIPVSVTNIGTSAFQGCSSLTNVTIGNGVTSIASYAFEYCGLTSVTIPASVTSIAGYAFYDCTSLTNVMVGNGVTNIGSHAFYYCTSLAKATIGAGVTNIGSYAFYYCPNLTGVYFQGNSPTPTNDLTVFSGDTHGIVYPLPGTTGWGTLFDGLPTALWLPQVQTGNGSIGVKSDQFGFNVNWGDNMVVVVEAATNLANPVWIPVSTNILTGGTSSFSDPQWTNYPGRYYRLSSP